MIKVYVHKNQPMLGAAVNHLSVCPIPPTEPHISQSDVIFFSLATLNAEMYLFRNSYCLLLGGGFAKYTEF